MNPEQAGTEPEFPEDNDPLLSVINLHEREVYEAERKKVLAGGTVSDSLWELHYVKKPPAIKQFVEDDYYLGRVLRHQEDNEGLFPAWKQILVDDFDLDSHIHNIVVTGALGVGKTWLATVILLYRLCVCTFLRNPQNFFGLSRGSRIVYNMLSITKAAVTETCFGDAMSFMAQSTYFTEVCKFDPDLQYTKMGIPMRCALEDGRFPNIWLTAGSKGQHILGRNIVGVVLDEGNFRLEAEPDLAAYELYDQVRTRLKNRFQKVSGFLPAISIIASSASDESSFTEKVIKEIESSNDSKTEKVYRYSVYQIKRHALKLKPWWFKVAYGLRNMEPFILDGYYNEDGTSYTGADPPPVLHEPPPPGARTELIPGDYHDAFRRNCTVQLQTLSGISTAGVHKLFPSMIDVERCLSLSEADGLVNPNKMDIFPISMEDALNVWDYIDHKTFLTRVQSRIQPKRHPHAKRYAHLDMATQSKAGVSVCHLAGNQLVEGLVKDGEPFSEYRLIVEYDFILCITAGHSKPINFEKVQRFIFWLRDYCGFSFGKVTADQFQSTQGLQMLEARGFVTDLLSIDRNKDVYRAWRTGFEELRIRLYRHPEMLREAEQLLEMDKKYNHPPDGTKDVSDACSGAYYNAINSDEKSAYMVPQSAGIYTPGTVGGEPAINTPTIEIPLPAKGHDRSKIFEA